MRRVSHFVVCARSTEKTLASLERQIYALETSYLEETSHLGNVITGWEVRRSSRSGGNQARNKFTDQDRLFSLTSVTAKRHTPLEDNGQPIAVAPTVVSSSSLDKKKLLAQHQLQLQLQQQHQQQHLTRQPDDEDDE